MAYVITDPCTKDEHCIEACPVDCIHPKKEEANFEELKQLFVDPQECIDCGACVPVCPIGAICPVEEVPAQYAHAVAANAAYYGR